MAAAVAQNIPPPPPGFTLDQLPGADAAVPPPPPGFTLDTAPPATAPAPSQPPSFLSRVGSSLLNAGGAGYEPALSMASGIVATPIAGIAGIGGAAANALGFTDKTGADVTNAVQGALTYEPRTQGGQDAQRIVQYPFQKLAVLGDAAGDPIAAASSGQPRFRGPMQADAMRKWEAAGRPQAEGDPVMGAVVNTAIQAVPSLLLRGPKGAPRAAGAAVEAPKPAPPISPRQALFDELNAKGLKVSPSQVEGATGGNIAEGLAGRAKSERGFSMKNAPKVNELVAEDVGLKGAKAITDADLTRLKVEANKPYNALAKTGTRKTSAEYKQEIANIGDRTGGESFKSDVPRDIRNLKRIYAKIDQFTAQDAISKIRQLRSEGSKNLKAINAPEQNAKGTVQKAIAEALDNELARHADSLGKPELAANYKAARVQLAKLHTLEDALEGSHVSAKSLAQALDRGAPLTGNMELVARAYKEFDRSFQDFGKVRDSNQFSVVDGLVALASAGGASVNPALLAGVAARPGTRAYLASDRYQRSLVSGQKAPARTSGVKREQANALARPAATSASQQKREAR